MNILDLIFPRFCLSCGSLGAYVCKKCSAERLVPNTHFSCLVCGKGSYLGLTHERCRKRYKVDGYMSLYSYNPAMRRIIKTIKYKFVRNALFELLRQSKPDVYHRYIRQYSIGSCFITSIPLHPKRLAWRGFNVPDIMGAWFAKETGMPFTAGILKRIHHSTPHAQLTREERIHQSSYLFSVNTSYLDHVRGCTVFVWDDIITTGATLHDAARALKAAGARRVYGLSLIRD